MTTTVIACGARDWKDRATVERHLRRIHQQAGTLNVVEGGANGADRMAGQWAAAERARGVGWVRVPADWARYGKMAGPIRNQAMLVYLLQAARLGHAVAVLAFHPFLPNSKGTKDMVERARKAGVRVIVVEGGERCSPEPEPIAPPAEPPAQRAPTPKDPHPAGNCVYCRFPSWLSQGQTPVHPCCDMAWKAGLAYCPACTAASSSRRSKDERRWFPLRADHTDHVG